MHIVPEATCKSKVENTSSDGNLAKTASDCLAFDFTKQESQNVFGDENQVPLLLSHLYKMNISLSNFICCLLIALLFRKGISYVCIMNINIGFREC